MKLNHWGGGGFGRRWETLKMSIKNIDWYRNEEICEQILLCADFISAIKWSIHAHYSLNILCSDDCLLPYMFSSFGVVGLFGFQVLLMIISREGLSDQGLDWHV